MTNFEKWRESLIDLFNNCDDCPLHHNDEFDCSDYSCADALEKWSMEIYEGT